MVGKPNTPLRIQLTNLCRTSCAEIRVSVNAAADNAHPPTGLQRVHRSVDPVSGRSTSLLMRHPEQSTATSRAAQMARIRFSASRPSRFTNTPTETLSTESRFTAERRGIGSEPGSRTTSLASPRMVVVHGATSARRSRGIAASRDSTTTGRRPISAISHHHTSPRAGSALTTLQQPAATTQGRPTRLAHQAGACRRPHSSHPPRPIDGEQVMPREPHR
ncbi:hypothetical protein LAUMK35_02843 [Mycobacterium pseudokansasii]|nr:hypothetical protein LAUMK35_02843 [Mycobacterium pseudokansasii]VAZ96297.1 hypothetical protein LAUMK21_02843 [Mycobacterium pseudokansasii]